MKLSDFSFAAPHCKVAPCQETGNSAAQDPVSLEQCLQRIVASRPDAIALTGGTRSLTFRELDILSERIARFIGAQGYGHEAVVGVLCVRGAVYLAAALGIMRAGAVYLPVEPEQPQARKEIMLRPAQLLIADSSYLREAEYVQYRNPAIQHVLCIDTPVYDDAAVQGSALSSAKYWEQQAANGSDTGWVHDIDAAPYSAQELAAMAAAVLEHCGLTHGSPRTVLDIGSGSGQVAQALATAASAYTAVDLANNAMSRISHFGGSATVTARCMEAADIHFFEEQRFDCIVMNGVVENFPGYTYLRTVLNHAVQLLAPEGRIVVSAVRDLDCRNELRAALQAYARASGDQAALLRHDASEELFIPRQFFTEWAAHCPDPVSVSFSPCTMGQHEGQTFRYTVTICHGDSRPQAALTHFGTQHLPPAGGPPLPVCDPEQAAYIVYTSGSTGVPKGVVVEHRNLLHILRALRPYGTDCTRVGLVAPLSFDASIQQLAVSIFSGNSLHVLSDEERKSPSLFYSCVRERGLELCDMTPAFFSILTDWLAEQRLAMPLKTLLLAGEVLRPDVIRTLYATPGNAAVTLFNVYGPTECTVDSSAFRIDQTNYQDFTNYPIGKPLEGVLISIRDHNGQPLPDSVTGELWISGDGVSRGYLNTAHTAAFVEKDGQRYYRTGDNAYTQNGLLFFRGREDQQVKIHGNRVELSEVETAIADFPGVRQVVVTADTFRTEEGKNLAAYVVGTVDLTVLRHYLEQHLPAYAVPTYWVPMMELPLTLNRKVDKKALPSPLGSVQHCCNGRKPAGAVEEKLAAMWQRLLGMEVTDADADFFKLGGHSILSIRLIAMIEKEMNVHVPIHELITHTTLAQLAELLTKKAEKHETPIIKLQHCEGGKKIFLFHPVGGSVFCYSDLARLLGQKYTIYAVEATGFCQQRCTLDTERHSVQHLAASYLKEILRVEQQDIIFGGWSFGGLLAYEAACQYARLGYKTEPIIILDTVADNSRAKQMAVKDDIELLLTILSGNKDSKTFDRQKLYSLPREAQLRYLVECGEKNGLLPSGFNTVQMDNLLLTYRGNALAAARYAHPTPSDSKILLVRALDFANNPQCIMNDEYQGWGRFLHTENITLRWTQGTHETILSAGLVANVAETILHYLG